MLIEVFKIAGATLVVARIIERMIVMGIWDFFKKSYIENHDDEMRNLVDPIYHKCRFCARFTVDDGKFYCNCEGDYAELEKDKLGEYDYTRCSGHFYIPYMDGCNRVERGAIDEESLNKILEEAKSTGFYPRGKWDEYLY